MYWVCKVFNVINSVVLMNKMFVLQMGSRFLNDKKET